MIEIAKPSRAAFRCVFFGYSDVYSHLIEQAGFKFRRMTLADLAVIHGGQGTVQTACAAGTLFVGIGLQPEQESNIDAIVRQGSAIRIRKRRRSRHSLLAAIEQLLHDLSARQRAQEIQRMSKGWNGTQNAAEFLSRTFS